MGRPPIRHFGKNTDPVHMVGEVLLGEMGNPDLDTSVGSLAIQTSRLGLLCVTSINLNSSYLVICIPQMPQEQASLVTGVARS